MIYITGDCHGRFGRFTMSVFPEQAEMTKDDYVIICGDFGGVWSLNEESPEEKAVLDILNKKNFTTLFICGNHENFERLYQYPEEEWHGGKIHKIRDSVFHLMRGQVFEIDGKKIFTFGGASSHDVQGGILNREDPDFREKYKKARNGPLPFRVNRVDWWKEELPSREELAEGRKNIRANNFQVDYIVTHTCAASTLAYFSKGLFKGDYLNTYLEEIHRRCKYKKWFFGHYHDNRNINDKEIMIYEQIIRIC